MAVYSYRCVECGPFEAWRPIQLRRDREACPSCGFAAARVFTAPRLSRLSPDLRGALDASGRSADRPDVVSTIPAGARRRPAVTSDPRHARLPRP